VKQRDDEPRAAHPERVADRDRTAVDVDALLVDPELAHDRERLRGEGLVELDEVDVVDGHAGPVEQLAHGGHRPDAHHRWVDPDDRRADERAQRLDPKVARPLLARDHERRGAVVDPARVAGRDRAALPECGLQRRELLRCGVGARVLVVLEVAGRDELVGEPPRLVRLSPALLRAQRESVLVLAAHAPSLGDVLARLAHRGARVLLLVAGVREPPAKCRVEQRAVPSRERHVGFRRDERRTRHRLDTAGHEQVAVPGDHRVARAGDCREARRAEPVHRHAGHGLRKAREQRREPSDVAVVLTRLVGAPEPDVLDLGRWHARALDGRRHRDRGEVVGPDAGESAPVPADGRPHGREDDGPRHPEPSFPTSSRTRCAIANAPFAAGTPQ
jgi:hypothetical protein